MAAWTNDYLHMRRYGRLWVGFPSEINFRRANLKISYLGELAEGANETSCCSQNSSPWLGPRGDHGVL